MGITTLFMGACSGKNDPHSRSTVVESRWNRRTYNLFSYFMEHHPELPLDGRPSTTRSLEQSTVFFDDGQPLIV